MKTEGLIDLIENIPEVSFLRRQSARGFHANVYQGVSGNPVFVDTSNEDIDKDSVLGILDELGVDEFFKEFIPED